MEKYIEAIIEIVLDNVSCEHELPDPEYPGRVGSFTTYSLDNEQDVIKKCLLIKPEAYNLADGEELIERSARALHKEVYGSLVRCDYQCHVMGKFRVQMRKILEEK